MTATAHLTALPEGGRREQQQGGLEIPRTPTACCCKSVECREKVVKPEPSEEMRLEENSGWRQRRGWTVDSRGHGGLVGRVRSWVASSASGQHSDVAVGPPRTAQRRSAQSPGRKTPEQPGRTASDSRDVRVRPPGDGSMAHKLQKKTAVMVKLGWGRW